jgi:DNA-binding MarR family transcriptional regulator
VETIAMTDATATPARSKRNNGEADRPVLVSGPKLALHFGCVRQHIDQLVQQGVIERRDGLFDQDVSRLKYLNHLRTDRRSPRSAADAAHTEAKATLLQIRIEEKRRTLVRRDAHEALIDQIAGTVLTHLSGMSARCSRDIQVRRNIDEVVMQIRREISEACSKAADECNEPPLNEQHRRCTRKSRTLTA